MTSVSKIKPQFNRAKYFALVFVLGERFCHIFTRSNRSIFPMKPAYLSILASCIVIITSLACSTLSPSPTATPQPTNTNTITPSPTKTPTFTPQPTRTPIPPTATAVPAGTPVSNMDYEVNVIKIRKLGSVYHDEYHIWHANPGYLFLELGVKVISKKTGNISWNNIYIINEEGKAYMPNWGGYQKSLDGTNINPANIIFEDLTQGSFSISLSNTLFFRIIWVTEDKNPSTVLFGFDTAPLIKVIID